MMRPRDPETYERKPIARTEGLTKRLGCAWSEPRYLIGENGILLKPSGRRQVAPRAGVVAFSSCMIPSPQNMLAYHALRDENSAWSLTHAFGNRKDDIHGFHLRCHHAAKNRPLTLIKNLVFRVTSPGGPEHTYLRLV